MSYALWDNQGSDYMHISYGADTLEELKDGLLSYISADLDDEEMRTWSRETAEEIAATWDMTIEQGQFIKENDK